MTAPACADSCRQVLIDIMAERGCEVHATWVPPLFPSGYDPFDMCCRHGVLWFMEPTAEQRLRWAQEGVQ